jgi:hypothetical protein
MTSQRSRSNWVKEVPFNKSGPSNWRSTVHIGLTPDPSPSARSGSNVHEVVFFPRLWEQRHQAAAKMSTPGATKTMDPSAEAVRSVTRRIGLESVKPELAATTSRQVRPCFRYLKTHRHARRGEMGRLQSVAGEASLQHVAGGLSG